jgi:mitogen-activated protein kinase kinase kinase
VHGDIKPGNALLSGDGTLKLADFGTATSALRHGDETPTGKLGATPSTQLPRLAGTPMYMAPEIIKGGTETRFGSADVWATGCVVLRMCTGRQPWGDFDDDWYVLSLRPMELVVDDTIRAVMFHIATKEEPPSMPSPTECSPAGIAFLHECLRLDADVRPTSAALLEHAWMADCRQALRNESPVI